MAELFSIEKLGLVTTEGRVQRADNQSINTANTDRQKKC